MPLRGPHSVTVPGAVEAWFTLLERFGTRTFEQLAQTPLRYAQMEGFAPSATFVLAERAAALSREAGGGEVRVGSVVTSGVFYDPDTDAFPRWRRLGHFGVEMEAAMLYTMAAVRRIEALAIMTVSDLLGIDEPTIRISDDDLKRGVDQMMRIACRVAVS